MAPPLDSNWVLPYNTSFDNAMAPTLRDDSAVGDTVCPSTTRFTADIAHSNLTVHFHDRFDCWHSLYATANPLLDFVAEF
jgi:hypothetical protein